MITVIQMWVVYAAWWKEDNGVGSFSWAGGLLRNNGGSWKQGLEKLRNNGAWAGNSYDEDKDGKNYKMETAKWMWLHSEMENKRNESSFSLRRLRRVSQACYIHSEIFTLQRVIQIFTQKWCNHHHHHHHHHQCNGDAEMLHNFGSKLTLTISLDIFKSFSFCCKFCFETSLMEGARFLIAS